MCCKEPVTGSHTESDESSLHHPRLCKKCFNIILLSVTGNFQVIPFTSLFPTKTVCDFLFSSVCAMFPRVCHYMWFCHPNNICWRAEMMKPCVMQQSNVYVFTTYFCFSPVLCKYTLTVKCCIWISCISSWK